MIIINLDNLLTVRTISLKTIGFGTILYGIDSILCTTGTEAVCVPRPVKNGYYHTTSKPWYSYYQERAMSVELEIDHKIGHSSTPNCLHYHPNGENFIFCSGWNVGIGNLTDSHSQEFMRGHDDRVTCITLSPSGSLIASGQCGENSDVLVWSFEEKKVIYSFEEHDSGVKYFAFSHDEKLLVSIGDNNDGKLIIWDLSNGAIVAASPNLPEGTTCVCFGGFVKDIKRRNTDQYQICTGGASGLHLWQLNPYSGELANVKIVGDARGTVSRYVNGVTFSVDEEFILATTSSGDYLVASVKARHIVHVVPAARKGLVPVVALRDGHMVGGGDGTVTYFTNHHDKEAETVLDGPVVSLSLSTDKLEVCYCIVLLGRTGGGGVCVCRLSYM